MKTYDYLHSDLLSNPKNNLVFHETYETIRRMSYMLTEIYAKTLDLSPRQKEEYMEIFMETNETQITQLVNFTIHNFEK